MIEGITYLKNKFGVGDLAEPWAVVQVRNLLVGISVVASVACVQVEPNSMPVH